MSDGAHRAPTHPAHAREGAAVPLSAECHAPTRSVGQRGPGARGARGDVDPPGAQSDMDPPGAWGRVGTAGAVAVMGRLEARHAGRFWMETCPSGAAHAAVATCNEGRAQVTTPGLTVREHRELAVGARGDVDQEEHGAMWSRTTMGSKKNQKKKVKVDSKPTRVERSSADSADSEGQDNGVQDIAPIEQDIPEAKPGVGTSLRRSTRVQRISTKLKMAAIIEEEAVFPADDLDHIPDVLVDFPPSKSKPGPAVVEDRSADFVPDQSGSESNGISSESELSATNPTSKPVSAGKKDTAKSEKDGTDTDETRTRINITSHTSFYTLIETLHDAISCSGVKSKPKLKYKLTRVTKAMLMRLQSVEDWEGLEEEIEAMEGKKKKNNLLLLLTLLFPMTSLTIGKVHGVTPSHIG
ncbi:hypothetical protein JB92DRAFT_3307972 [Gautieria morchelliformis]|nr:hypothetical protein JB92DRAFT_3307972 [Gautieria morchelliformis]